MSRTIEGIAEIAQAIGLSDSGQVRRLRPLSFGELEETPARTAVGLPRPDRGIPLCGDDWEEDEDEFFDDDEEEDDEDDEDDVFGDDEDDFDDEDDEEDDED